MARDITSTIKTEVGQREVRPILLLKMAFDSADGGDLNFWNGVGDLVWNGDTYTGTGDLGSVSDIEETSILKAAGARFTISGIPSGNISIALSKDYPERIAKLWLGFVDQSVSVKADPVLIFSGRMDVMEILEEGETATISIRVENRLIDLERPKLRNYTNTDQKREFAGDDGLEFVAALNDGREIVWGRT